MARKRHTPEHIIRNLREAEVKLAKCLKELEKENARLKKVVADQALDNSFLKEAAEGNF